MNQRNIFIGISIVLVIGAVGYFAFVKNKTAISPISNNPSPSNSSQPVTPNSSTEEKILEITHYKSLTQISRYLIFRI